MDKALAEKLKKGAVGIMPTDTIYGLVGLALSPKAVKKIYELKQRPADLPFIILVGRLADLTKLGITITAEDKKLIKKIWPGPVSIVLPCPAPKFKYLHRGSKTLALRFPADEPLVKFLQKTGPLVATSVNPHGEPAATSIKTAKKYFGDRVDFYLNDGPKKGAPSTLVKVKNGKFEILRPGLFKLPPDLSV